MPDLKLVFSAISDVGRVRKDNQDSGYAGPWLLAVADGVGGAARGDLASATAIQEIRKLDAPPPEAHDEEAASEAALAQVAGSLHRAHDRIGELVDQDSSLNGTSTTAIVALFDGQRLAFGHVGDSRAYLLHEGVLNQVTTDHTFVQTLIDDGRITPEEARTHPHKNLILKAIDSVHEVEPDLFHVDLVPGDRVLLCSDGVLSLTDARIADILGSGNPDYAAVELVRAALEAGSNDNVTAIVAEAVPADAPTEGDDDQPPAPLLVGSAADLPRRGRSSLGAGGRGGLGVGSLFRGHRAGDTGELEPVQAEIPEGVGYAIAADPVDPEQVRYAPRPPERFAWLRRFLVLAVLVGLVWIGAAIAWGWSQDQYYVGSGTDADGNDVVMIYRGLNADLPGVDLSHPYESTNVSLDLLSEYQAGQVREGIDADSYDDAKQTVENLADTQETPPTDPAGESVQDGAS
ncbi:PP2C family protein-serine/threonine phosphatase [Nocardioides bigeumensis]|uniref:Stp1/IreP family PP2C-type Ser/Thr phosphatase n=1 Tax=Nocardioides bigeumensis TaxID=433657 RepID=A0ABP5KN50_9ACTN